MAKMLVALRGVEGQAKSAQKARATRVCLQGAMDALEKLKETGDESMGTSTGALEYQLEKNERALIEMEYYFERLLRATEETLEDVDIEGTKDSCGKMTRALECLALIPGIFPIVAMKALKLLCKYAELHIVNTVKLQYPSLGGSSPIENICASHVEAGLLSKWLFESFALFAFNADTGRVWRSLYAQVDQVVTEVKMIDATDIVALRGSQVAIEQIVKKKARALPMSALEILVGTYIEISTRAGSTEIRANAQKFLKSVSDLIAAFEKNKKDVHRRMYRFCREAHVDTSWFPDDASDRDEKAERAAKRRKK